MYPIQIQYYKILNDLRFHCNAGSLENVLFMTIISTIIYLLMTMFKSSLRLYVILSCHLPRGTCHRKGAHIKLIYT